MPPRLKFLATPLNATHWIIQYVMFNFEMYNITDFRQYILIVSNSTDLDQHGDHK